MDPTHLGPRRRTSQIKQTDFHPISKIFMLCSVSIIYIYLHLVKSALQLITSRRKSRGIVSSTRRITSSPQSITACLHIERKKRSSERACFFFADITRLHTLIVASASSLIPLIFFNSIENVFFYIGGNS